MASEVTVTGRPMADGMCYVGIEPACGCVVAACVDTPERRKEVRAFVRGIMRDGLDLQRVTVPEARTLVKRCVHRQAPPTGMRKRGRRGTGAAPGQLTLLEVEA